jgi:hypothetical protein
MLWRYHSNQGNSHWWLLPKFRGALLREPGHVAELINTWLKEKGCWIPHTTRVHKGIGFDTCPWTWGILPSTGK